MENPNAGNPRCLLCPGDDRGSEGTKRRPAPDAALMREILAGVLGGLFAFGIVGLFIGPMVLAVSYPLLVAWIQQDDAPAPSEAPLPVEAGSAPVKR